VKLAANGSSGMLMVNRIPYVFSLRRGYA